MADFGSFEQGGGLQTGGLGNYDPKDLMSIMIINQTPILKPLAPFLVEGMKQGRLSKQGQAAAQGLMQMQQFIDAKDWQGAQNSLNQAMTLMPADKVGTIGVKFMDKITAARVQSEAADALLGASSPDINPEDRNKLLFGGKIPGPESLTAFNAFNPSIKQKGNVLLPMGPGGQAAGQATVIPSANTVESLSKIPGMEAFAESKGIHLADITNALNSGDPKRIQQATGVTQLLAASAPQALMEQELRKSQAMQNQIGAREVAVSTATAPTKIAISAAQGENAANRIAEQQLSRPMIFTAPDYVPVNKKTYALGDPLRLSVLDIQKDPDMTAVKHVDAQRLSRIGAVVGNMTELKQSAQDVLAKSPGENFLTAVDIKLSRLMGTNTAVAGLDAMKGTMLSVAGLIQGDNRVSDNDYKAISGFQITDKDTVAVANKKVDTLLGALERTRQAMLSTQPQDPNFKRDPKLIPAEMTPRLSPGGRKVIPD
mgnify:FL=1